MKKITLFLLLMPLLAMQCEKNKNDCPDGDRACELAKLPPLTTEGKGTFGCLVNGKAWLPKGSDAVSELISIYYDEEQGYYLDAAYNKDDDASTTLAFNIVQFSLKQKKYDLFTYVKDSTSRGVYTYCWDNRGCNEVKYYTDVNHSGVLNIQFIDSTQQIISGTFDFTAKAENGEIVYVTDGRFDMWFEVQ